MLRRIYVHNYRTLVAFEWHPPMACVLVGANGSGKSALFDVLWLVRELVVEGKRIDELGFPASRTVWLDEPEQVIELGLELEGQHFVYRLVARLDRSDPPERSRASISETLHLAGKQLYLASEGKVDLFGDLPGPEPISTFPFDRRRSFLATIEPGSNVRQLAAFRDALAAMWTLKPDPLRIVGAATREMTRLDRDLGNFANWYRTKVQEDFAAATRLRDDLVKALPGFSQLRLEAISSEARSLRMKFDFGSNTHEIGWDELSEGQRLLVVLYGVLRFGLEHARLIALDEVENYVAPEEIQPWLRAIVHAAAEGNRQLIVISHHRESIDYLAADAAWSMSRDPSSGASRIERLEPDREAGETAYDLVRQRRTNG